MAGHGLLRLCLLTARIVSGILFGRFIFEIYCYCDRILGAVGNLSTWLLFTVFKLGILTGRACFVEINILYLRGESREQIGRL